MNGDRGQWGTRLGFILAAAGSAVGLGNVWKFPYMAGQNGGGAFLIVYVVLVFSVGLSVMLAEFAIGRAAERNPVGAFAKLKGSAWPTSPIISKRCRRGPCRAIRAAWNKRFPGPACRPTPELENSLAHNGHRHSIAKAKSFALLVV